MGRGNGGSGSGCKGWIWRCSSDGRYQGSIQEIHHSSIVHANYIDIYNYIMMINVACSIWTQNFLKIVVMNGMCNVYLLFMYKNGGTSIEHGTNHRTLNVLETQVCEIHEFI